MPLATMLEGLLNKNSFGYCKHDLFHQTKKEATVSEVMFRRMTKLAGAQ